MSRITLLLIVLALGIISGCATNNSNMNTEKYNNPLPECPDSPNCERLSYIVHEDVASALTAFGKALENMHALEIEAHDDGYDAVFKIPVFGWKDDVNIRLETADSGKTVVHMRSASRIGYSDLGVNRMRVKKIRSEYARALK